MAIPRAFLVAAAAVVLVLGLCSHHVEAGAETQRFNRHHGRTIRSGGNLTLAFFDDFDDLDLTVWQPEITMGGGGNWEFEMYLNNRSNSYVRDSILYIKPTLTSDTIGPDNLENGYTMDMWGLQPADMCTSNQFYGCLRTSGSGGNIINPIQSSRIRTSNSFSFTYGQVEVRARLPVGDWLWPAVFMMPKYNTYGRWPCSGEIDIMESRGNAADYPYYGVNSYSSTLHFGPYYPDDPYNLTHAQYTLPQGQDFSQEFHIFGVIWNENGITTYLDEETNVVLDVDFNTPFWELGGWENSTYDNPWEAGGPNAPFDQEFFLIMNVACGGTSGFFPDNLGNKPWSNSDPHAVNKFWAAQDQWYPTWNGEQSAMQIDYVKVWTYDDKPKKRSKILRRP